MIILKISVLKINNDDDINSNILKKHLNNKYTNKVMMNTKIKIITKHIHYKFSTSVMRQKSKMNAVCLEGPFVKTQGDNALRKRGIRDGKEEGVRMKGNGRRRQGCGEG